MRPVSRSASLFLARPISTTSAIVLTTLSIVLACGRSYSAEHETVYRQRLTTQAPHAWDEYYNRVKGLQSKMHLLVYKDGKVSLELREEFRHRGDMRLCIREYWHHELEPSKRISLGAVNADYAFQLQRRSENRPWALNMCLPRSQIDLLPTIPNPKEPPKWLMYAYIPFWMGIHDQLTHPNFSITAIREVDQGGRKLLRVDFEHTLSWAGEAVSRRGWFLLDAQRYWIITDAQVTRPDGSHTRAELQYNDTTDRFPLLHSLYQHGTDPLGAVVRTEVTFDYWDKPLPSEEEFRLTYYGIPEPEELRWHKPTPWWLYTLLTGLALVLLGFGIYTWRRYRRATLA